MEISPIRTEPEYEAALERTYALMDAVPDSPEEAELDVLATLIQAYEAQHYPIEAPDPVEYIKNTMLMKGLDQSALSLVLESRSRASEILNRKRPLTLVQIRKISAAWQVPATPLIAEYLVG